MKRYGFILGVLVMLVTFMVMGQTYITNVKDWLIEDSTLRRCDISGSINVLGTTYYCDNNHGSDAENGLSWTTAVKTLAKAMELSHAKIASGGHATDRNIIYYTADTETADMTTLAQKTDIIGVGNNDPYHKACIVGTWIVPSTTAYPDCRFYNMQFYDDDAGGSLWDVTSQGGLEFHDCLFQANATSAVGLELNDCGHAKVIDCWFGSPDGQNFTSAAIQVQDHATGAIDILIKDNYIHSNSVGIDWNEATNVDCWIDGNRLFTAAMIIDTDDATEVMITNNIAITLLNKGDNTAYDFNLAYAAGNIFTAANDTNSVPSIAD